VNFCLFGDSRSQNYSNLLFLGFQREMLNENPSCSSSASLSSRSNSSGSYSNQPSSSSPLLQRQEETKGCSQDLKEQCWYWAAATKEEIGTAMEV
jgi:hypothetical protein